MHSCPVSGTMSQPRPCILSFPIPGDERLNGDMNDETEPIPVVDPRGDSDPGRRRGTGRRPQDRSDRPGAIRAGTPPWNRSVAVPPAARADHRVRRARTTPPPRPARRRGLRIAGRTLASVTALVMIAGTGLGYYTENRVDAGFTRSEVISQADAAALDGDMNILLIGLDTRKDKDGKDLPKHILDQLHAGDGSEGGYNANSLILVHIPKDLKKVTAFSIPRDDYVRVRDIPGYDHAKIKEAYGLKKAAVEQKLENQGVDDEVKLEHQGREAGRKSIVQTVTDLTGVPINRFAEVSLVGFYDLAHILGGVDVCLNHAVDDSYYSGAVFPAGHQHLDAAAALSFVRQRHGLDNGDLDRTHRQQAFLTSVAKQLKDSGTLTDFGKLQQLVSAAQHDVVLSQGWNLLDFAQTLGSAGSLPIEFRTLPVRAYDTVDGQAVNVIDPAAIKKTVRTAFGMPDPEMSSPQTPPTSTVDVVNAGSESGMAAQVSNALTGKGFTQGEIGNATYSDGSASVVYYGAGGQTDATQAADMLGGLPTAASDSLESGHVKVVLGSDFYPPAGIDTDDTAGSTTESGLGETHVDPTTGETITGATSAGGDAVSATTGADGRPDAGKPVTTSIGADIPCVN